MITLCLSYISTLKHASALFLAIIYLAPLCEHVTNFIGPLVFRLENAQERKMKNFAPFVLEILVQLLSSIYFDTKPTNSQPHLNVQKGIPPSLVCKY